MGIGTMETGERCERCGYVFEFGDRVHEATVAGEYMILCPECYRNIARRG